MDEHLHNEELLMRYINNEMIAEERNAFASMLENDPSLRQRLESMQITIEALKMAGTAAQVKAIHQQMIGERKQQPAQLKRMFRPALTVAASLIILLVAAGGWWFYQLSPEEVYSNHYIPYALSSSRSTTEPDAAMNALYIDKEYREIISRSTAVSLNAHDSLLVALSYLETNQPAKAIQWFIALQNGNGSYKEDAEYYLGMCYLRTKEYKAALQLMERINRNKSHLYQEQVSGDLLRKLRFLQWK